jgi:diguanylate cyclase (GGDEF)-like protein
MMKNIGIIFSFFISILFIVTNIITLHNALQLVLFGGSAICLVWFGIQYDHMKYHSENDYLTGVYTRRYIYKKYPRLQLKVNKNHGLMHVYLLDLNNFKMINDKFGHDVGDLVLKHVSSILRNIAKNSDIVGRWGGDEFIILSPNADPRYFNFFNNKLESELRNFNQQKQLNVQLSIGKAIFPYEGKTLNDLIKIADKNMYQKKKKYRIEDLTITDTFAKAKS